MFETTWNNSLAVNKYNQHEKTYALRFSSAVGVERPL
jgi:hypothetical protein